MWSLLRLPRLLQQGWKPKLCLGGGIEIGLERSKQGGPLLLLRVSLGNRAWGVVDFSSMDSSSGAAASCVEVLDGGGKVGIGEGGSGKEQQKQQVQRCQSWLPTKRRFCAAHAVPGLMFCGNHKPSAAQTRVPCPVDPSHDDVHVSSLVNENFSAASNASRIPTQVNDQHVVGNCWNIVLSDVVANHGHSTVLQEEVPSHVKKCPATSQLDRFEQQAYYCKGLNAGSDDDMDEGFFDDQLKYFGGRTDYVKSQRLEDGTKATMGSFSCARNTTSNKTSTEGHFLSSASKRTAVSTLSKSNFEDLVARIEEAFRQACGEDLEESIMRPQACSRWLDGERDRRLPFQEKHAVQQASLLGNLEAYRLLDSLHVEEGSTSGQRISDEIKPVTYVAKQRAIVELGAGRGYLSHMLCDCYNVQKVIMVERRAYKFKADRTMRQANGMSLERLRLDIEDLNLNEVRALQDCHVTAISKHLCGPATDLSLRCCLRFVHTPVNICGKGSNKDHSDIQAKPMVDGLGIATCCHHLCQWKSYVNKRFFRSLGFSKDDFHAITWLTSWALSGTDEHGLPDSDSLVAEDNVHVRNQSREDALEYVPSKALLSEAMNAMDATERSSLGRKCKHLIDTGRLLWLRGEGMQAKLVEYIAASVSPENKLLLARYG